jgi:hypothetical protein
MYLNASSSAPAFYRGQYKHNSSSDLELNPANLSSKTSAQNQALEHAVDLSSVIPKNLHQKHHWTTAKNFMLKKMLFTNH